MCAGIKKKFAYNSVAALLLQITGVVCGFILPKYILAEFGSGVNGLTVAITRFLSIISLLDFGLGYVIQASLYKPLAERDWNRVSEIITSGGKFFRIVARILLVYVAFLIAFFPHLHASEYSWLFTATLIGSISISYFAQYYFGVIDRILLNADLKGYIQYSAQIVTLILNTVASVILIEMDASIQMVKLVSSLIFLARPVAIRIYVNRKYQINRYANYEKEPIQQKWNGIAMHVSSTVLDETDVIVLTIFSTLSDVSIYSIYHMVVYGVKQLIIATTGGFDPIIGRLWAQGDMDKLRHVFSLAEWWIHTLSIYVFTWTGILILPFVAYYTDGIVDADYIQPLFALIIVGAHALHCLRLPYNKMIFACGMFKQTQSCYIIAAVLNVVLSSLFVWRWGLVGVGVGTLISMVFQTAYMVLYNEKHIIHWPIKKTLGQFTVDIIFVITLFFVTRSFTVSDISLTMWFILAIKVGIVGLACAVVVNLLFYRKKMKEVYMVIRNRKN